MTKVVIIIIILMLMMMFMINIMFTMTSHDDVHDAQEHRLSLKYRHGHQQHRGAVLLGTVPILKRQSMLTMTLMNIIMRVIVNMMLIMNIIINIMMITTFFVYYCIQLEIGSEMLVGHSHKSAPLAIRNRFRFAIWQPRVPH